MSESYLLVFDSTHTAIQSTRALTNLDIVTMPTPSQITSGCGISVKLSEDVFKEALETLRGINVLPGMFRIFVISEENAGKAGKVGKTKKYTLLKADSYEKDLL